MPYVPPHKRLSALSADAKTPTPSSPPLIPRLGPPRPGNSRHRPGAFPGGKVIYAPGSTSLWWPLGAPDSADPIPTSFRLEHVPGGKHLVLAGDRTPGDGAGERPWEVIGEKIEVHLFACVRRAMEAAEAGEVEVKLAFLARIGKVRFEEGVSVDSIRKAAAAETNWNKVHKLFYTYVSDAYMEDIQHKVVPKIELSFESAKEHYHVKVYDKSRPGATISCKCMVGDDGKLNIHKIELNPVRHMVVDLSCLYKDLDFRLMLVNKRRLISPDDVEKDAIDELVKSAILDPAVKGGLRWPIGKNSVTERFNIVGAWHTKYRAFIGQDMRLKLRHADRFDHRSSTGEVFNEVTLKLPGISKKLRNVDLEREAVLEMIEDAAKLIWGNFLTCNS